MLDDFITKIQVEEIYDEQQLQELHEFYDWINNQPEQELSESGQQSLCKDSRLR
jgi:hypothetical protein